jgi:exonuclease VII small subunit
MVTLPGRGNNDWVADKSAPRTGRERIKTLAQAALNADLTVEQLDTVLNTLTSSLAALDSSIEGLDKSLVTFNSSLSHLNEILERLERIVALVDPVIDIVNRVERIVDAGETAMAPLAATENAVRQVVKTIRDRAHL